MPRSEPCRAQSEAAEAIPGFRETQRFIAEVNRSEDAREERELQALDDAIAGTDHRELAELRAQLNSNAFHSAPRDSE
jgi:hypothetical protein